MSHSEAGVPDDPKARFREALERKKKGSGIHKNNSAGNAKIHDDRARGNVPKIFRRKSGSA